MDDEKTSADGAFSNPDSIEAMEKMYLAAVRSIFDSMKKDEKDSLETDVMYLLAQAQARWLSSALKYWVQIATIVGKSGIEEASALKPNNTSASAVAQRVKALDKARATLREISSLSLREAKLLQSDLMKIEADLRQCMNEDDDLDRPRRFAKITE